MARLKGGQPIAERDLFAVPREAQATFAQFDEPGDGAVKAKGHLVAEIYCEPSV